MIDTEYDRIDYGGDAHLLASHNIIGGMARLLGLPATAPEQARVLELGCGNASNLIPLAYYWPRGRFTGVDLAGQPLANARQTAAAIGLSNLRLIQADVARIDPAELGQFDYVIAHGFLSWVPPPVQHATLRLIAQVLAPAGVAYLSFNTYPGCRIRHLGRELMQYHIGTAEPTLEDAQRAQALMQSMLTVPQEQQPSLMELLVNEAKTIAEYRLNYLIHDDLAPHNHPFYLHEFAAMLEPAGLAYLGDADPESMFEKSGNPDLTRWLDEASGGDWLRRQQYLDFARSARFRRSLICKAHAGFQPALRPEALASLRCFANFSALGPVSIADDSEASFLSGGGRRISTNQPLLKAVFCLAESLPEQCLGVEDLAALSSDLGPEQARAVAANALLRLISEGLLHPIIQPPGAPSDAGVDAAGPPPLNALTRELLLLGRPIVDKHHRARKIAEGWTLALLQRFDGMHDWSALLAFARSLSPPDATDQASAPTDLAQLHRMSAKLARDGMLMPRAG